MLKYIINYEFTLNIGQHTEEYKILHDPGPHLILLVKFNIESPFSATELNTINVKLSKKLLMLSSLSIVNTELLSKFLILTVI